VFTIIINMKFIKYFFLLFLYITIVCGATIISVLAQDSKESSKSELCNGHPRYPLQIIPGYCVYKLMDGFGFLRNVLSLEDGRIIVVDQGEELWKRKDGRIWVLEPNGDKYNKKLILNKVDLPHGLAVGPNNWIYFSSTRHIYQMFLDNDYSQVKVERFLTDLPKYGLHAFHSFFFNKKGEMYIMLGSTSDACERKNSIDSDGNRICDEMGDIDGRGLIRKYLIDWNTRKVISWNIVAKGIRNAPAMGIHPKLGMLYVADNGRDNLIVDGQDPEDVPPDLLYLVKEGKQYLWPYCYAPGKPSPEFSNVNCNNFSQPIMLLPAHAVPLDIIFLPELSLNKDLIGKDIMLLSFHNVRKNGQRIVYVELNDNGLPKSEIKDFISIPDDKKGELTFFPAGMSIIKKDGSILITDGRGNGNILHVVKE